MLTVVYLYFALSLAFGADIESLGSADFRDRDSAFRRLQRSSLLVAPLLSKRVADGQPDSSTLPLPTRPSIRTERYSAVERQFRIDLLLDRTPTLEEWFSSKLLNIDLRHRPGIGRRPLQFPHPVPVVVGQLASSRSDSNHALPTLRSMPFPLPL